MEELSDGGSQNPLQSLDFVSERIEHIDLEDHAVEDGANHGFAPEAVAEGLSYDDLKLPETTVVKIMKEVLPKHAIISKEVKNVVRRISTIFILFITDCAVSIAAKKKRKTVLPDDIFAALKDNDFEQFTTMLPFLLQGRRGTGLTKKGVVPNESADTAAHEFIDPLVSSTENEMDGMNTDVLSEVSSNRSKNNSVTLHLDEAFDASEDEE